MNIMNKTMKYLAGGLLGTALAVSASAQTQTDAVRIGTSSPGSGFYAIGIALSQILSDNTSINSTVEPVGGSVATVFGVSRGDIELALSNSVAAYDGYHGNAPFMEPVNYGLIAQGARSYRQLVVNANAGIESPEDLSGKTLVGERPAISELAKITQAMIDVYGLEDVRVVSTTTTGEAINALESRTADAALLPGGIGSGLLSSLTQNGTFRLLSIPEDDIEELMSRLPASVSAGVIPANTYNHQDEPVNAFYAGTTLNASGELSEDLVYEITRAFFEGLEEFHTTNNEARAWTLERTFDNPVIPFHPGAVRYFREAGHWNDSLESRQQSSGR